MVFDKLMSISNGDCQYTMLIHNRMGIIITLEGRTMFESMQNLVKQV